MKTVTLLFLLQDDKILLAMKKRGFGAGKWNGVGGKLEPGETPAQAAVRECQEEIGVTPLNPQHVGRLKFYELTDPDFLHDCHIFTATKWQDTPVETEEMRPQWFKIKDIPYDHMWADDTIWLPHVLAGNTFTGKVVLDGDTIHKHDITPDT